MNTCDVNTLTGQIAAECVNEEPGFRCDCPDGYEGNGLENTPTEPTGEGCNDVDECALAATDPRYHNCVPNSDCVNHVYVTSEPDGGKKFECLCKEGYVKLNAGTASEECANVDECATAGACDEHADCADTDGSFTCTCRTGYTGDGLHCEDIDECNPGGYCDDEATCANLPGSYTCSCPVGYTGDGKGSPNGCVEVDECSDGAALPND